MKKVISFSLWGKGLKYSQGMVRNAELAKKIYPDWECWVYCSRDGGFGPANQFLTLSKMDNVKLKPMLMNTTGGFAKPDWRGMFWRFEPTLFNDVDVMISRDCDSRLSFREKSAVDEWLESDKGFHTIHDHFHHSVPMLGGMWGMKCDALPEFKDLLQAWPAEDRWQTDQDFLTQEIWPRIQGNVMNHAEFHHNVWPGRRIPMSRVGREFIGAGYDAEDVIDPKQTECLYG